MTSNEPHQSHPTQPQAGQAQPDQPQYYFDGYRWVPVPPAPPATPATGSIRRRALLGVGAGALAVGLVLSGVAIGNASSSGSGSAAAGVTGGSDGTGATGTGSSGTGTSGSGGVFGPWGGNTGVGGSGSSGTSGTGSSGTGQQTSASVATATQSKGIVTIVSTLGYQNAESAGTGMILTSSGEVLTNNHVVSGATGITVTDETTGRSYSATVVGTDATDDVAVIQLKDASGLTTAAVGDSSDVDALKVGSAVTGVGNAGGTGTLTSASGSVTALDQTITASDESGGDSETLHGLIQFNAAIRSGDSGGPLYDSDGDIVGINTAGSTSGTATTAYAIAIDDALAIVDKIEAGQESDTIQIGLPAFLGVGLAQTSSGAVIASVVNGGPAADAGITAGDTITAVGGTAVSSAATLKTALAALTPGQTVTVTWTDSSGSSHSASVTLVSGPAA